MVHINVDGALFSSSRGMRVGVVIRNHRGDCLAACSELIVEISAPELAEVLAMHRAILPCQRGGFRQADGGLGLPLFD
jgi:hypothetical protein